MDKAGWKDYLLGDLITLQRGYDITKKEQSDGLYPVVSSSGPSSTHIAYTDVGPGVVIGRKGTLGKAFYISGPYWAHDTTLWVKDFKGNDRKFVFYLLKSMNLAVYDVGSSNPTLNRNHLHLLPVRAPDVETQHRVADVLSAYDDLIEVNQRRIAILEEMARRVFDEWFVRFRYPGHEAVPLVETELGTIPEGWKWGTVQDVVVLQRGFDLPNKQRSDGPYPVIAATGEHGLHSEYKVRGPGVVTGRSGSLGKVMHVTGDFWPLNTALWGKDYPLGSTYFAYFTISNLPFGTLNAGAAVPSLNRNHVHLLPQVVPSLDVVALFDKVVAPMFALKRSLLVANARLRAGRDLLLPKLISGEIHVSTTEEAFAEAAE